MKLTVTTPLEIVVDASDVAHVRAEDETGAFGILNGHADFLTALEISVVTWRSAERAEHYIAVRGGMLRVTKGALVEIACAEAVPGEDLHRLESETLTRFRRKREEERDARRDANRLYLSAIRQICRYLRPGGRAPQALGPTLDPLRDGRDDG